VHHHHHQSAKTMTIAIFPSYFILKVRHSQNKDQLHEWKWFIAPNKQKNFPY